MNAMTDPIGPADPSGLDLRTLREAELVLLWYAQPSSRLGVAAAGEMMRRINEGLVRVQKVER